MKLRLTTCNLQPGEVSAAWLTTCPALPPCTDSAQNRSRSRLLAAAATATVPHPTPAFDCCLRVALPTSPIRRHPDQAGAPGHNRNRWLHPSQQRTNDTLHAPTIRCAQLAPIFDLEIRLSVCRVRGCMRACTALHPFIHSHAFQPAACCELTPPPRCPPCLPPQHQALTACGSGQPCCSSSTPDLALWAQPQRRCVCGYYCKAVGGPGVRRAQQGFGARYANPVGPIVRVPRAAG